MADENANTDDDMEHTKQLTEQVRASFVKDSDHPDLRGEIFDAWLSTIVYRAQAEAVRQATELVAGREREFDKLTSEM